MPFHNINTNIVFIIGVGRSGTSLLQSVLSSHSQICIPRETGFLRSVVLSLKRYESLTFEQAVNLHPRLKRVSSVFLSKASESFANEIELYGNILESYRKQQNKKIVGDKDPGLIEYINAVSRLLPEAKFIHMVRDPRDVLLSKKKAAWSKNHSSLYHIIVNYVQLKLGELMGRRLGQKNYHIIEYENLLQRTEPVVSELCEFLGVEFEKPMLHFQEKAGELVSEDELQWKKETMGSLLKDNFGKWEGELIGWEVALTELLCRRAFQMGVYTKSDEATEISIFKKWLLSVATSFLRGIGTAYVWYRLVYQKIWVIWKT